MERAEYRKGTLPVNTRSLHEVRRDPSATLAAVRPFAVSLVTAALCLAPRTARAEGLEVYPAEEQDPSFALEVHGAVVLPFERSAVCPTAGACVLGTGFGAGGYFLGRLPIGLSLLAGYEVWLLDGGGVYEVSAIHSLRVGLRWILEPSARVQPYLQGTLGGLLLTDPAQASTAGGLVTLGAGLEVELTESVALNFCGALDLFSLAAFSTRDGLTRARDFGVNVGLEVQAGVVIQLGASGAR